MNTRSMFPKRLSRIGALLITVMIFASACTVVTVPTPEEGSGGTAQLTVDTLRNAAYQGIYKDQTVQLTDGKYEGRPFVEGGASRPTVIFTDHFAFGDLNGDGVEDAAVVMVESSGGSGNFVYLSAVNNQSGSPENLATQLLGDRTQVQSIAIENGEIVIETITHGPNDPMCCPTQKATVKYQLQGYQLVAIVELEGTEWVLVSYGDPNNPGSVLEDNAVTAVFDGVEGKVSGSAGCNRYFGGSEVSGSELSISTIGSTMMACDEELMEQEQLYLTALQAAESYQVEGSLLLVFYSGSQVLTFAAQESASSENAVSELTITEPAENAVLDINNPIKISGTGRGLFEGNVVLQVWDSEDVVIFEEATTLQGENVGVGGSGTWEITLQLDVEPGGQGAINAFSTSPRDGSITAWAGVSVTFGETSE